MLNKPLRFEQYIGDEVPQGCETFLIKGIFIEVSMNVPHNIKVIYPSDRPLNERVIEREFPLTREGIRRFEHYMHLKIGVAREVLNPIGSANSEDMFAILGLTIHDEVVICGGGKIYQGEYTKPGILRPDIIPTSLNQLVPGCVVPWSLVAPKMEGKEIAGLICVTPPTENEPGLLMTGDQMTCLSEQTDKDLKKIIGNRYRKAASSHLGKIGLPTEDQLCQAWEVGEKFNLLAHGSVGGYRASDLERVVVTFARHGYVHNLKPESVKTVLVRPMCPVHLRPQRRFLSLW
jgi:hypothetical protein